MMSRTATPQHFIAIMTAAIFVVLVAACSSKEEDALVDKCQIEFYNRGIVNKETGVVLTPQNDFAMRSAVYDICRVKAGLYAKGYRVLPFVEPDDIPIYISRDAQGVYDYYMRRIRM